MQRLTKVEEEIMQIIWQLGPCTVSQIRDYIEQELGQEKPPHSSVSSIVRALDNKNGKSYVGFKAYGRTYEYFPLVSKETYSKGHLEKFAKDYFEGSMERLVSFIVKEENMSPTELEELIKKLDQAENKKP